MDAVTGTDTYPAPAGSVHSVLAGVRRLTLLADGARDCDAVLRALARELLSSLDPEEVHVHHLGADDGEELVAVYMFDGDGKLSYLLPRSERPPGVSWVANTGRSVLIADGRELAESVPRLAQTGATSSALLLPLVEHGAVEAVVMLVRRLPGAFDERSVELARTLVDQAGAALALVRARAEAGTDAVAGCMNHRAMRRRLDEEIGRATRAGSPLSCILIDLDDFKLVNDEQGHQAGDAVLREVVQALVGEFRAFDRVARYGGDEFVVILPNADLRAAAAAAARALERMRAVSPLGGGRGISASIGVAQWHAPMSTDELLHACDLALLRSKREGKGRVTRATEPVA
ncbi:MAG TPA: sensor domain-containing diguanylate cyclase [Solirubrobacteraceae bacterium]|nr:sensor domain-containing diguanylate cyclase [Solirubrobacteraceae bacterium]